MTSSLGLDWFDDEDGSSVREYDDQSMRADIVMDDNWFSEEDPSITGDIIMDSSPDNWYSDEDHETTAEDGELRCPCRSLIILLTCCPVGTLTFVYMVVCFPLITAIIEAMLGPMFDAIETYLERRAAKKEYLEAILVVYRDGKSVINRDQLHDDCVICLEGFDNKQQEIVVLRDCKHYFHLSCILGWTIRNNSCPYCRCEVNRLDVSNIIEGSSASTINS